MQNQDEKTNKIAEELHGSGIEQRKADHIDLAFNSKVEIENLDRRFLYEPVLSGHASKNTLLPFQLGAQELSFPIWVSSMTGGTQRAASINKKLAMVCNEFGLGMGLGSCRQLLNSNDRLNEFDVRHEIGTGPLYANLGIAQLEQLLANNALGRIEELVSKLRADGLIIHINPLQEWMQPEGDHIHKAPIDSIKELMSKTQIPLMVKEVGQGMGKESLRALLSLPLVAIELAGNGGTNFSKLELLRADELRKEVFRSVTKLGHSAEEMVDWCNELYLEMGEERKCNTLIVSGGIKSFLDGYYLIKKSIIPAIYAQASGFLKYAIKDYSELKNYVELQIEGLQMANAFLKINDGNR